LAVYERTYRNCPNCGLYTPPTNRSSPEFVDGDLLELDAEILARLRGEITRIDGAPRIPQNLDQIAQRAVANRHLSRQHAQVTLREAIAGWAGYLKANEQDDSEIYRRFYHTFKIDIASAQSLGSSDAEELTNKINRAIDVLNNSR